MDSLQRAKQFLARKASKLALAIIPLAALAVTAPSVKAGAIVDTGGDPCYVSASGGSCLLTTSATGGNAGLNWLQLSGFGTATGSGSFFLDFSTQSGGTANGAFLAGGQVPISWDFFVSGGASVNWSVTYQLLLGTSAPSYSGSGTSTGGEVTGSALLTVPSGGDVVGGYFIALSLNSSAPFTATIPAGGTLDLNPGGASTPEPASLLMVGAAGAFLVMMKRRKTA